MLRAEWRVPETAEWSSLLEPSLFYKVVFGVYIFIFINYDFIFFIDKKEKVENQFKGKDVEILVHRYIFFSIFPLLVLRALTSRIVPKKIFSSQDYAKQFVINRWINKFLDRVLMLEKTLFSNKGHHSGAAF